MITGLGTSKTEILRWDPYHLPDDSDMDFRLTYEGPLLAATNDERVKNRPHHVHAIRRVFHKQLRQLWRHHPTLLKMQDPGNPGMMTTIRLEDFNWRPLVTKENGCICKIDILLLRYGPPGGVMADIDNRLKTIFDALQMPTSPNELGAAGSMGQIKPKPNDDPFYVLLQNDRLITHVSVTSDTMLEAVPNAPKQTGVRLVVHATIRPYDVHSDNLHLA